MDEKQFKQLLKQLKIAENKSYDDIMELLDARLDEYLDRQDDASQEIVSQIHDAMDYAEEMQKEVGRGITIREDPAGEQEEPDYESLKKDANREGGGAKEINAAPDQQQGRNSTSGTSGRLWFVSIAGAANVDNMFRQAEDDLKYGEWQHATDIFEMILQVEANNPSAYLGRALAENHLSEPKNIGTALDKPMDTNVNLRRAFDHGNDLQKKYLQDALGERKNAIRYKEAERAYENARNVTEYQNVAAMFDRISYYRDAEDRSRQCREKVKELIYKQAVDLMHQSYNIEASLDAAIEKFSTIEDYKDAKEKIRTCRENKKEVVYWEASRMLRDQKSVEDIRVAVAKFIQVKGYKDAEALEEQCRQLIPVMEGNNRKKEDAACFENGLSRARNRSRKEYISALSQCEEIYKKVKEIKESNSGEAQFYADVDLKKWSKDIRAVKRERRAYVRKERIKNTVAALLVVFTFLLGPISVNNFGYVRLSGVMSYLPIPYTTTNLDYYVLIEKPSAVVFSLTPGTIRLHITEADRLKYVIMPFANITEYVVSGWNKEELYIPEMAKGIEIRNASKVESIDIPRGATSVSISDCPDLKQVSLPDTIENDRVNINEIGENAKISFLDEEGNITRYHIPDWNEEELAIPETVTEVEIENASNLESIDIPRGVTSVSISNCPNVKQVFVPDTIEKGQLRIVGIGENARISFLDGDGNEEGYIQGNCRILLCDQRLYGCTEDIAFEGDSDVILHNANYGEAGTGKISVGSGVRSVTITDEDMVSRIDLSSATDLSYLEITNCSNLQEVWWPKEVDLSTIDIHMEGNPLLENATEEAN